MITFKALVISSNRRKDGTYPVKIRVTYKGVSRRLPTTLVATSNDLTRSLKIKNATILTKTDQLIAQMREAVSGLSPFTIESWTVDDVVAHIKSVQNRATFRLDFFEWADAFILTKKEQTRPSYYAPVNALERFVGKRELDINAITRVFLVEFLEYLRADPYRMHYDRGEGTATKTSVPCSPQRPLIYLSKLQHIYNAAKVKFNDEDEGVILIPRSPFGKLDKYLPTFPKGGQRSLGVEVMQRIISADTCDHGTRFALDFFVISFALMGANMSDLYEAERFEGDWWIYHRKKTRDRRADKSEMHVKVPAQLRPYIARMQNAFGRWWLPAMHGRGDNFRLCNATINRYLKQWAAEQGIEPFTGYAARHTWATLARSEGIEKALVDECLAHKGDFSLADIYAERSWSLMAEANAKVLALFEWPK